MSVNIEKVRMNKKEVCEYVGISRTTLDRWLKRYDIPYVKIGQKYLFEKKVIDDFLAEHMIHKD